MTETIVSACAALLALFLAVGAVVRGPRQVVSIAFATGMLVAAAQSVFAAAAFAAGPPASSWQRAEFVAVAFLAGPWLTFSAAYARGESLRVLKSWAPTLAVAWALGPAAFLIVPNAPESIDAGWLRLDAPGRVLSIAILVGLILTLMNLERTFRASVGLTRWRVKFVCAGLAMLLAARVYSLSQCLIFSARPPGLATIDALGLCIGGLFVATGYLRHGLSGIDIYPSSRILQGSLTFALAGAYLFVVGLLARQAAASGSEESFPVHALLLLLGIAGLAAVMLSERLRQRLSRMLSRHFKRPQHDSRAVWTALTSRLADATDERALAQRAAELASETFSALTVRLWLKDPLENRLQLAAATNAVAQDDVRLDLPQSLTDRLESFDLDACKNVGLEPLKAANPPQFPSAGARFAVPLAAGEHWLGVLILADRVNALAYTVEETDLLNCIAGQAAGALLNLRLSQDVLRARELEAFQNLSAFFVHDLKNAASSLNLLLRNIPLHFDKPAFREDALRSMGAMAARINRLIEQLTLLRETPAPALQPCDANAAVRVAAELLGPVPGISLTVDERASGRALADPAALQSVLANLLVNAREALDGKGAITLSACDEPGRVLFQVADNGPGMTPEFVRGDLFRPFRTTKAHGLGVGMFQTRRLVEAMNGMIDVRTAPGQGTVFGVRLPAAVGD